MLLNDLDFERGRGVQSKADFKSRTIIANSARQIDLVWHSMRVGGHGLESQHPATEPS